MKILKSDIKHIDIDHEKTNTILHVELKNDDFATKVVDRFTEIPSKELLDDLFTIIPEKYQNITGTVYKFVVVFEKYDNKILPYEIFSSGLNEYTLLFEGHPLITDTITQMNNNEVLEPKHTNVLCTAKVDMIDDTHANVIVNYNDEGMEVDARGYIKSLQQYNLMCTLYNLLPEEGGYRYKQNVLYTFKIVLGLGYYLEIPYKLLPKGDCIYALVCEGKIERVEVFDNLMG